MRLFFLKEQVENLPDQVRHLESGVIMLNQRLFHPCFMPSAGRELSSPHSTP